jgi:hypothetical protein
MNTIETDAAEVANVTATGDILIELPATARA